MDDSTLDALFGVANQAPSAVAGNRIVDLVQQDSDLEQEITALELRVSELKADKLRLLTVDLPEAMAQAQTSKFTTANGGLTVEVKNHVSGSLASGDKDPTKREAQIAYVVKNGGEGIVTADVVAKFGKANLRQSLELAKSLRGRDDCVVVTKEDINHMVLKKWGRERIEAGLPLEPEKAGLWAGKIAVIKAT